MSVILEFGPSGVWLALLFVPLLVGILGAGLERGLIRHVYGRGQLAQILLTFGLLLIIYDTKQIVWGTEAKNLSPPTLLDSTISLFGFSYSLYNYFMIASDLLLALVTWALLHHTRFGLKTTHTAIMSSLVAVVAIRRWRGVGVRLCPVGGETTVFPIAQ